MASRETSGVGIKAPWNLLPEYAGAVGPGSDADHEAQ